MLLNIIIIIIIIIIIVIIIIERKKTTKIHFCEHLSSSAATRHENKVNIVWNNQVNTVRTIRNHKPDIIIRNKGKMTCLKTHIVISGERIFLRREVKNF